MAKKSLYLSRETRRLLSLFDSSYNSAIRRIIIDYAEGRLSGSVVDVDKSDKSGVMVDEDVWYLVNNLKLELGYASADDLVFDLVCQALTSSGIDEECILRIVSF